MLRLHAQFQPRGRTQIFRRKFTEMRKHNRCACSHSFFSPDCKNDCNYMDFLARLPGLRILARFQKLGWHFQPSVKPSALNRRFHFKIFKTIAVTFISTIKYNGTFIYMGAGRNKIGHVYSKLKLNTGKPTNSLKTQSIKVLNKNNVFKS